jgi:hypothetical protein
MVGIPLFLLCIANISVALGDIFRIIYSRTVFFLFGRLCRLNRSQYIREPRYKRHSQISADHAVRKSDLDKFLESRLIIGTEYRNSIIVEDPESESFFRNNRESIELNPSTLSSMWGEDRLSVPLAVAIFIICVYIWLGSFIFSSLEGWSQVNSIYFAFITMATVGNCEI